MKYTVKLELPRGKYYKREARKELRTHKDPDQGYNYSDYAWRIRARKKTKTTLEVTCRGTKYRMEVRRLLLDPGTGKLVVPDLNNSAHYGHSGP